MITPQAIRDFLTYAYSSWSPPAPQYVLLVGDGTYDAKDISNLGTVNFVPPYLSFTEFMGETVTDDWFARVSGNDAVPDLYIGRLPASSAADAEVMVDKIVSYEQAANTKSWEKNTLLVADNRIEDYEALFELMNEEAAQLIPAGFAPPFRGYLDDYPVPGDLTADITEKINAGALLVHYSGHGSVQIWAHENVFDSGDVALLANDGMLPFVVGMSCLNGYFAYPGGWNFPSLAEALLRAENRGAVAAFMPTGMTAPEGQHILDRALFEALFTRDVRTLGPAISTAKQTLLANGLGYEEVSTTFLLFGDPAMKLKVPLPERPQGLTAQGELDQVALEWAEAKDCDGGAVAGYHLYRSAGSETGYTRINTSLITGTRFLDTSAEAGIPYDYVVTSVDSDGDESVQASSASATRPLDSDSDTLPDDLENATCTDPHNADSDGDNIPDGLEDTNQNGLLDSGETDPCDPDTDRDELPDGWELAYGLDPVDASGVHGKDGDFDGDTWTNHQEFSSCTAPNDPDSVPHAPTTPAVNYPENAGETTSLQPLLSVSNGTDPDCQTLTYHFEVYADPGLTLLHTSVTEVEEGENATTWQVDLSLNDNMRYYWRARAYDTITYSGWMETATFFVNTAPELPSVPGISQPADHSEATTLAPTLEVTNSTDVDGDPLTYEFELYGDGAMTTLETSKMGVLEGEAGVTSWQVDVPLLDNTSYWWRARARDDDNMTSGWSSLVSFFVNTQNDAPSTPPISSPRQAEEVAALEPALVVHNSLDPDLDAITYLFEIDTVNTFDGPLVEQSPEVAEGAVDATSWRPAELSDNTAYYWRARACDGAACSDWSSGSFFVNLLNDAPSTPTILNPGDGSEVTSSRPTLAVNPATDPDLDQLTYDYELYGDADLLNLITSTTGGETSWRLDASLMDNRGYYWRVRAVDEHGAASGWSAALPFSVNTVNDRPAAPTPNNPVSGGTVTSLTPVLSLNNASDPDTDALTYEFELYSDPNLTDQVASGTVAQTDLITSWSVGQELLDHTAYYWRARTNDGDLVSRWMATAVFEINTEGAETTVHIDASQPVSAVAQTSQTVCVNRDDSPVNGVCLEIPPGALTQDCTVTIGWVVNPPALPENTKAIGRVIDLGPDGLSFSAPVTLRIPYTQADLDGAGLSDPAELEVFTYDTSTLTWIRLQVESVDEQSGHLLCSAEHFSMFASANSVPTPQSTATVAESSGGGGSGCFIASTAGDPPGDSLWCKAVGIIRKVLDRAWGMGHGVRNAKRGSRNAEQEVLPEFAWMNVYGYRFSALTLPGQGELRNKEHAEPPLFRPSQPGKGQHEDLIPPPPEHCH